MRRWACWGLLAVCLAPATVWAGGRLLSSRVVECTSTPGHAAAANANRTNLTLQNVGANHISIGFGIPLGITLHVGASVQFEDYQGSVSCQVTGGREGLGVMEESQ